MEKKAINLTAGGWAQANLVRASSEILFLSGQVPQTDSGIVPNDVETQCRMVWGNIDTQLRSAAMTYANLVKLTIFLADRAHVPAMVKVRSEIFDDRVQPAVTTIIAALFDSRWQVEIEAIAAA